MGSRLIGIAFAAFGWFRKAASYRARIVVPVSCVIAAFGLYAAAQRALLPDWPAII